MDELGADGSTIRSLTGTGGSGGEFGDLTSLAVSPDGSVWVADPGTYSVDHFSGDGTFISSIGGVCSSQVGGGFFTDSNQMPGWR